ncbi:histidinol phosphate phosphatase [Orenia metallireducens]|jgi:histidinol-phosphatase (PHP family)|uniref:Histidinol-phosphatase n=1 Tax=Orenia metallireducens TaxID=1413210 RepID=A0A1C0AB43_9FIRM|nr:histidinol-phosphatase HisJ family protein [Orenia metallireducens]OCL27603.1 histidinol phosphate phosphatase [Orenia metallireducens]
MLVDYHTHILGHMDRSITEENIKEFLDEAVRKGISEIGFTDHNRYYEEFDFDLILKVAKDYPNLKVKKGIEMDYTPGEEKEIKDFLDQFDLDYAIGSIHFIGDWMFDHPDYTDEYDNWDIDDLYRKYFKRVEGAAKSGLFQLLGHLDLIKVFNFRPASDVVELVTPTLEIIAKEDITIEINTNGMNKPAKEFYPGREILEKAYELGIKVTTSSDAHRADRVGENLDKVREMLLDIGYTEIATFENKKRIMVKL